MLKPTAEDVRDTNMATLADAHVVYIEAIRKFLGREGLERMGEENRIYGLGLGRSALESGNLRKGDLKSIFDFFDSAYPYFGFALSIGELTDKRFDLRVTKCPWVETFKSRGAGTDICWWVTKMDEGIGQVVDPDVKLTLLKCMMRGDDHCIYRWEKE
ncbi:MAG: hypothetical protein E4H14_04635 [Candidatus Thorarchaeota archaeon]|nr:MAG: hypothetical protein E4H14_04635 [Candidatus Thorarchaeota archaeon]